MATSADHAQANFKRARDRVRFAVLAWVVFAAAIAAVTLMKRDVVTLVNQDRVIGSLIADRPESVTIRVKGESQPADRVIPRAEIDHVSPMGERSVSDLYRRSARNWWAGRPLYSEGVTGFLYLPQAALVFSPFAVFPVKIGEVLWRWAGLFVYAWGVWRLARLFLRDRPADGLLLASLLAIPAAIGSAQNGQTNLVIGGLFALAAAACAQRRFWWATLWLMLAFACKPVVIPVILLLAAVYPRMIAKLAVGAAAFALAPFVHPDPAYVLGQYQAALAKIIASAEPDHPYQELRGMLMDFGVQPDSWSALTLPVRDAAGAARTVTALTLIRGAAAAAALGMSLLAARRFPGPARALFVVAVGVAYIMIFSPRTEGVTYAMIGPMVAVFAARETLDRRWVAAAPLIVLCLLLQFSRAVTNGPNNWVRPLGTIVFAGYLCRGIVRGRFGGGADKPDEGDTIPAAPVHTA